MSTDIHETNYEMLKEQIIILSYFDGISFDVQCADPTK